MSQISNVPHEPDIEVSHINIQRISSIFFTSTVSLELTTRMPAPDITYRQIDARPALGHV